MSNPLDPFGYYAAFGRNPPGIDPLVDPSMPALPGQDQIIDGGQLMLDPEMRKKEAEATKAEAEAAQAVDQTIQPEQQPTTQAPQQPVSTVGRDRRGNFQIDQAGVEANAARNFQATRDARSELAQAQLDENTAQRVINEQMARDKEELASIDNEYIDRLAAVNEQHQAAANERLVKIEEAMNAAAAHRVKPGRLWNTDIGSRLSGSFAAFIGGFLSAGGVNNNIQSIIDRGIDRDIQAQLQEKQDLKDKAAGLIRLDNLHQSNDDRKITRMNVERMARRASLVTEMEAHIQRLQDPVLKAKGQQLVSQQKLQLANEFENQRRFEYGVADREVARNQASLEARRQRAHASAMQKRREQQSARAHQNKLMLELAKNGISSEMNIVGPDGKPMPITVMNTDERKGLSETLASGSRRYNLLQAFKQEYEGGRFKGRNAKAEAMAWMSTLMAAGNNGKLGGQFSDKDAEWVLKKFGIDKEGKWVNPLGADVDTIYGIVNKELAILTSNVNTELKRYKKYDPRTGVEVTGAVWQPKFDTTLSKRLSSDFSKDTTGGQDFLNKTQDIQGLDEAGVKEALITLIKENPDPTPPPKFKENMDPLERAALQKEWNEYNTNLAENRRKNLGALQQQRVDELVQRANELGIREIRVTGRTPSANRSGLGQKYLEKYGTKLIIPEIKLDYGTR